MRTWLEQDLKRESRGAAGREQMPRLPEVCVRVGQIRRFDLVEAKPLELIDPPQEALAVRTRLKSLTTLCFAVLHISPRRVDNSFRRLSQDYAHLNWCGSLGRARPFRELLDLHSPRSTRNARRT